jgi:hypothetical protein
MLYSDELAACQAVGEAAFQLGLEGLLAPSATHVGDTLTVLVARLRPQSAIQVTEEQMWNDVTELP